MLRNALISAILFATTSAQAEPSITAPVAGFARSFIMNSVIPNATITILETGEKIKTDAAGHFGPFQYPIGKPITLQIEKWEYKTTQTGTYIVPKEGLTGPYNNITFQVPSIESFYLLQAAIGASFNPDDCHVASTVIKFHKTLDDVPQGEPNATVELLPATPDAPFYFGIFESGPLKGKTNPFIRGLTQTSDDGGIGFFNVPARDEPYTLIAKKDGVIFTQAKFICKKGAFVNISPPSGPMVLE
jgi:hypothetical protein